MAIAVSAIGMVAFACGLGVTGEEEARRSSGGDGGGGVVTNPPSSPTSTNQTDGGAIPDSGANDAEAGVKCSSTRGPAMVSVDGKFCIDATEVTNAQYLPFYQAALAGTIGVTPPPQCAWNTSYLPAETWATTAPYFVDRDGTLPVHAVDWCDAWTFCKWAGKQLCGSLRGEAMPPAGAPDASTNAWSYACSAAGAKPYPYGPTYQVGICNANAGTGALLTNVTGFPQCVGGYPGIFDMSGNAWEWDDSCSAGNAEATCYLRGGSATRPPELVSCATAFSAPRNDATGNNGIRCCAY